MEKRQITTGLYLVVLTTLFTLTLYPLKLQAQESLSPAATKSAALDAPRIPKQQTALASAALVPNLDTQPKDDPRVKILEEFLKQYDSPLVPHAATFVREADKYRLDYRLVAAISGLESTFGHYIPYNSYNAWGWGVYGNNVINFTSYDEAIETISKELRHRYMNRWGATTVLEIGRFYASSPTWASRVVYFMEKIREFEVKNPQLALSISL